MKAHLLLPDAEIPRQAERALRDAGVRVGYVTHMYDLASSSSVEDDENVLFLRAERRPDGTRPFKLVEGPPLPTSYGVELFEQTGGFVAPAGGGEP